MASIFDLEDITRVEKYLDDREFMRINAIEGEVLAKVIYVNTSIRENDWPFSVVYNIQTKEMRINNFLGSDHTALRYNMVFKPFVLNNPSVAEIESALTSEFLTTLFKSI